MLRVLQRWIVKMIFGLQFMQSSVKLNLIVFLKPVRPKTQYQNSERQVIFLRCAMIRWRPA